jgi:D-alanyl-lipoteichoic acid acyltransferase DltB (MBOAT superfamily)
LIIATLFFAIQIYCDFSGYSDIAIGAAKTMGFHLMTNFNKPYFSKNIQEFWKRWHISLSTWFRDYLYISLGGNRVKVRRIYFNVAVVFLVSGFWHGANWTYIIWGALHAFYILLYMYLKSKIKRNKKSNRLLNLGYIAFTFFIVSFAWIFFRANSLSDAFLIVNHIFTLHAVQPFHLVVTNSKDLSEFGIFSTVFSLSLIAVLFFLETRLSSNLLNYNKKPLLDIAFCTVILFLIIMLGVFNNNSFIYFQF